MAPRIEWVEEKDASGPLAEVYRSYMESSGRTGVAEILKCFSQRPDFLADVIAFSNRVHFSEGHLNRRTKEMIATYVSALNHCPY
jgi:alkylhydroperoxidase family enzyme